MNPAQIDLSKATFSDEIQGEAISYFERLFTNTNPLPVSDFIKQMITFRDSTSTKDRVTAEVFGGFIKEGVVEYLHFAAVLRRVTDAVQAKVGTNLFTFGIIALQACKEVLHRYPKVCTTISSNRSFSKFPAELRSYVNAGCNGELADELLL
uniref:CNOT1_TTP_bind domain-containing protein n=1 Tax=Panagrellus redivivus TaxID=6233 RepID=A0A7E4ZU34_PANRE